MCCFTNCDVGIEAVLVTVTFVHLHLSYIDDMGLIKRLKSSGVLQKGVAYVYTLYPAYL